MDAWPSVRGRLLSGGAILVFVVWNRKQAEERTGFLVLQDALAPSWDIAQCFMATCQVPRELSVLQISLG